MIVMPSNNTGIRVGYLAGRYPGKLGHLLSPGSETGPFPFLPYALDNGAYGAFTRKEPFDVGAWRELLEWARDAGQRPLWCLVPDVVGDRLETLRMWDRYAATAAAFGWPLSFAAQDGMSFSDVPREAAVVFLGGSTEWKHAAITPWCRRFPRVHVGRINTYRWLRVCEDAGAESVDGTGRPSTSTRGNQMRYTWEADYIGDDVYTESLVYDNEREEDGLPVIVARCYSQADAKRLCALLNAAPPTSPDTTADKE